MSGQPIIQRAIVTLAGTDDQQFPVQQVTYQGKTADAEVVFPYGLHANLLTNETLCVLFAINNEEDNRAVMGYTPNLRPTGLDEGEVVLYHPVTGSQIFFRNNGDIDIITDGDEGNLNLTIKKDLTLIVGGDANITVTGEANLTAPTTNVIGDVNIDGNLDITGTSTASNHISGTVSGNSHVHTIIQPNGTPSLGPT